MRPTLASALVLVALGSARADGLAQEPYKTPPRVVVDILDAPPLPSASVSPDRSWMLLLEERSMPSIAELAQPMLRLAGLRVNPRTNGPWRPSTLTGLVLKRVTDGVETRIRSPEGAALGRPEWAPDSRRVAFTVTREHGIELWVAEVATGSARAVTPPVLNAADGAPCQWMPSGGQLLCRFVPEGREAPPAQPLVPRGPTVQETSGRAAPVRTYQDLLENAHDEALFDYYLSAELRLVDPLTGGATKLGGPGIYDDVRVAPDGAHFLVVRTTRPYSYLVPASLFPQEIEVWTAEGQVVRRLASLPLAETVPIRGVRTGPRAITWHPLASATLVWAEALDGGDPRRRVAHRDRVVSLAAPFTGEPVEVIRTGERFAAVQWTDAGLALALEFDRARSWSRTWILEPGETAPRKLWDRSTEDRYADPGRPLTHDTLGRPVIRQRGDWVYLTGAGASPAGDRPFLDRLNLRTLETQRLWQSDSIHYEAVVELLDPQGNRLLTRRESQVEPPNYYLRDLRRKRFAALTALPDPAPQLTGTKKELVVYQREDGVQLSGTLYLPPGYTTGARLPVVVWAYPREFVDPAAAGQVSAAPNRYTAIRGPSHLLFLTQGYAVFDGPAMPIVGGDTANNRYVEQLVASARAAVEKLVALGVADPERIGVGGHSYGAFMTANLLVHSDLFRAGIARSGAYNRTLTPFGFQNESRTYWQAPEVYQRMSPFSHADRINEPILMIHGEADDNSGTFPVQSQRLYHAIKGLGGTARFVTLPHEAHGYAARESVLHTVAEMLEWFDRHLKGAPPRATGGGGLR